MVNNFFLNKISDNFPYVLTKDQKFALEDVTKFLFSRNSDSLFLLEGYAGTGKSSLLGAVVRTMNELGQKVVLLAPTGRAAKVFSGYANQQALTIHKKIYRQERLTDDIPQFSLSENLHKNTLFIVDEASMISSSDYTTSIFGSGDLLDDLIEYVYSGERCRLILVGDNAQLPPVKQEHSPALDIDLLRSFSLEVESALLTENVRQEVESGILYNATLLREALRGGTTFEFPRLHVFGFADIKRVVGLELIDEISDAYRRDGIEETVVIARSNRVVNSYNKGIRGTVLYREEELSTGDLLMITKNNYFWIEGFDRVDFLANGEFVEVVRVRSEEQMYGFRFCDVTLYHKDYDIEFDAKILLDVLHTEVPGLTREQNNRLFQSVMDDYSNIRRKQDRYKKVKSDVYFNALQVKYGYAVTCHKAQGGEWKNVFLDIGYIREEYMGDGFYRWLYTAITRSSENLYLVNIPNELINYPDS